MTNKIIDLHRLNREREELYEGKEEERAARRLAALQAGARRDWILAQGKIYEPKREPLRSAAIGTKESYPAWRPTSIDDPGPGARHVLERAKGRMREQFVLRVLMLANVLLLIGFGIVWGW
jgi:hypothetical protein